MSALAGALDLRQTLRLESGLANMIRGGAAGLMYTNRNALGLIFPSRTYFAFNDHYSSKRTF
jgi:hypothetical protein